MADEQAKKLVNLEDLKNIGNIYVKKSGDTMTGALKVETGTVTGNGADNSFSGNMTAGQIKVGEKIDIRTDAEGGNIRITSPSGNFYEMDAYNGTLRIWGGTPGATKQLLGKGIKPDVGYLDMVYPVGAVYLSTVSTSPASLFGGSWERITGYYLRAGDNAGTAGAESFTIASNNLPAHSHSISNGAAFAASSAGACLAFGAVSANSGKLYNTWNTYTQANPATGTGTGTANAAISYRPTYKNLYVWERTA